LRAAAGLDKGIEIDALAVAVVLQAGEVADRRVEPDVEVFLLRDIRYANAEIGRIARDVPVGERFLAFALEPFLRLVHHLWLQPTGRVEPAPQEIPAARIGQAEEVV